MATPLVEQIAAAIATKLATITEANGYENTVSEVVRPARLDDYTPDDRKLILLQGARTREDDLSTEGNPAAIAWRSIFVVVCHIRLADTSTAPVDTTLNALVADVEKALMADPQWSGLAIDAELEGEAVVDYADDFSSREVEFAVIYRTDEDDPYQSRN